MTLTHDTILFSRKHFLFILLMGCWALSSYAQGLVINEVAWMGTAASSDDEWMELYNGSDAEIDVEGWTLEAADGTPSIALTGTIPAGGYFLLERTDDSTVGDIEADQIYTGALGNGGERLLLKDNLGEVVDEVNCSEDWYAGTNAPKATMERKSPEGDGSDPSNWETNDGVTVNGQDSDGGPIQGTPGAQNSVLDVSLSVAEAPTLPRSCALTPNYPNPFNPTTTVGFVLSEKEAGLKVTLVVYSVRGEVVTTLVDRKYQSGVHAVPWNGCDDDGMEVSSGIYFVSLQLEGQPFDTRCMLKMK